MGWECLGGDGDSESAEALVKPSLPRLQELHKLPPPLLLAVKELASL